MAITERYVRSDAAGGGDGTTDTNSGANGAFTLAEAIADAATPHAGYRYNIKAGTYSLGATTTFSGDGTSTSPIVWRGFNSTPGDLDANGRSSGGALNTTNFPVLAYSSTFLLSASGANFNVFMNLKVTGTRSGPLVTIGSDSSIVNCQVDNNSTNAAAEAIQGSSSRPNIVNCDALLSGASGGNAGINMVSGGFAIGNRVVITGDGCPGIEFNAGSTVIENTIIGGTVGIVSTATSATNVIYRNTIYSVTGNGIDIVTGTTATQRVVGNHITDCGGYAIAFNSSTCLKLCAFNRTRDNTSGVFDAADDWTDGTTFAHVTTDGGDATTDFTNPGTDMSLIAAAPGISKAPSYLNDIGANGTPVVASGSGLLIHPGMVGGMRG